jgi:hypothetical protein
VQLTSRSKNQPRPIYAIGLAVVVMCSALMLALIILVIGQGPRQSNMVEATVPAQVTSSAGHKLPALSKLGVIYLGQSLAELKEIIASPFLQNSGGALQLDPALVSAELPGATNGEDEPIIAHCMSGQLDLTDENFITCQLNLYFWDRAGSEEEQLVMIELLPPFGKMMDVEAAQKWLRQRYGIDSMTILIDKDRTNFAVVDGAGDTVYVNIKNIRFVRQLPEAEYQQKLQTNLANVLRAVPLPGTALAVLTIRCQPSCGVYLKYEKIT